MEYRKTERNIKKIKILSLIFIITFLMFFSTIVYSALYTTCNITGVAYSRVEADVRITNFMLASTNNATSSYEDFAKNHIVTEIDLTDTSSSLTYYLEITNYGSIDVGIFDITGLPTGLNYSIKDYSLHDKICDDTGKCNSFIKKTYELTLITTSTYTGSVQLNFDFRTYHTIEYINITNNNYPTEVIDGGTLNITFAEDLKRIQILSNDTELTYYSEVSNGQTISVNNITSDIEIKIKEQVANLVSGDIDVVGSVICIGDECFNIISNDGETVTLLAQYSLGTNYRQSTTYSKVSFATADGWDYTPGPKEIDIQTWSSNPKNYVNNYVEYLNSELGDDLVSGDLITLTQLKSLGCTINDSYNYTSSITCADSTYAEWIVNGQSWWTKSAYPHFSDNIYKVEQEGAFNGNLYTSSNGVRPVIELSIDKIVLPLVKIVSGDMDTVGSEICISDECFYVISSDDDSVTMLAKYNLLVGNTYDNTNGVVALENPTGIQDSTAIGWFSGFSASNPIIGNVAFSSTNYWKSSVSSYPAYVYDSNSTIYLYVENYKTYLEGQGATIEGARLITYEELETLGCSGDDYACEEAPSWVYSTTYWSGSASDNSGVWMVDSYAVFGNGYYSSDSDRGVRPVITIPRT